MRVTRNIRSSYATVLIDCLHNPLIVMQLYGIGCIAVQILSQRPFQIGQLHPHPAVGGVPRRVPRRAHRLQAIYEVWLKQHLQACQHVSGMITRQRADSAAERQQNSEPAECSRKEQPPAGRAAGRA